MNLEKSLGATATAVKSKTKVMASESCAYTVIRPDTDFSEAQQKSSKIKNWTVFLWLCQRLSCWFTGVKLLGRSQHSKMALQWFIDDINNLCVI